MKKILCILLVVLMLAGLAACGETGSTTPPASDPTPGTNDPAPAQGGNDDPAGADNAPAETDPFADMDEITLVYNSTRNEAGDAPQLNWLAAITEATGGKVKFDTYMSSSLIPSPRDIPEGIATGIADIGLLNINNYPGVFPLNDSIVSIPLSGIKNSNGLEVMDYLYANYPALEQEFTNAGLKLLGWNMASATNLGVKLGKEYSGINDVKGVKITATGEIPMEILAAVGAVPVSVAYPDIYQSLEKNVINGLLFSTSPVVDTSFHEHIDNWILFGEDSAVMFSGVAVVMGLDKWNSLPEAVKAVFEATEHDGRAAKERDAIMNYNTQLQQILTDAGKHFVVLTDEQVAEWEPYIKPIAEKKLADMEASYPGFTDMYNDMCAYIGTLD